MKALSSIGLVETCNEIETLCRVQVATLGPYLQRLTVAMIGGRLVTVRNRSFLDFAVEHYFSDLSDFEFDCRQLYFTFLWRKDAQQQYFGFSQKDFSS